MFRTVFKDEIHSCNEITVIMPSVQYAEMTDFLMHTYKGKSITVSKSLFTCLGLDMNLDMGNPL